MHVLNLDEVDSRKITAILDDIPQEETGIEIKASTNGLKKNINVMGVLKSSHINTLKLSIDDLAEVRDFCCFGFNFLPPNINTVYLDEEIMDRILNSEKNPFQEKEKRLFSQLEKLIIIDANGVEIHYEGHEAITARLNRVKKIEKVYFKPNIETLQLIYSSGQSKIDAIIANIPDDQTELDLSGIDLTQVALEASETTFYNKLPPNIKTLKLYDVNLHNLTLYCFYFFESFLKKFNAIHFSFSEIENLFKNNHAGACDTKIAHLIEGTANATVHLIKSSGKEIVYTSEEFKTKLASRHTLMSTEKERQRIDNHKDELHRRVGINFAIQHLSAKLQQEIKHFEEEGKSCLGFNSLHKANKLQQALDRAKKIDNASVQVFLNHKENGAESISEALAYHRIGFFGKPKSQERIDDYVKTLRI